MITLITIIFISFLISIFKTKRDSGGWDEFDPYNSVILVFLSFFMSGAISIFIILYLVINFSLKYLP